MQLNTMLATMWCNTAEGRHSKEIDDLPTEVVSIKPILRRAQTINEISTQSHHKQHSTQLQFTEMSH